MRYYLALLATLLCLLKVVSGLQHTIRTQPRAAFVVLAHDSQLDEMVTTMHQLEAKFNRRYHYHWVFFTNMDFSEEFKIITSNATNATCVYEQIPKEHWYLPQWINNSQHEVDLNIMCDAAAGNTRMQSDPHIYRWNSGLFAREKRLRNYDWFWKVEPGARFTCDIEFDVFSFMRDNDMAYGFNKAVLDDLPTFHPLLEKTQSFIDTHRDLLDAESDYTWLLDKLGRWTGMSGSKTKPSNDLDDLTGDVSATIEAETPNTIVFDGEAARLSTVSPSSDRHIVNGAVTARLGNAYDKCSFYSSFEIGSLSFFRSPQHLAYFDHLDSTGGLYSGYFGEVPMHSLSASMFLPKQSVWILGDGAIDREDCTMRLNCPPFPRQTPHPESQMDSRFLADLLGSRYGSEDSLTDRHTH